jgi:hypothetical protein
VGQSWFGDGLTAWFFLLLNRFCLFIFRAKYFGSVPDFT